MYVCIAKNEKWKLQKCRILGCARVLAEACRLMFSRDVIDFAEYWCKARFATALHPHTHPHM